MRHYAYGFIAVVALLASALAVAGRLSSMSHGQVLTAASQGQGRHSVMSAAALLASAPRKPGKAASVGRSRTSEPASTTEANSSSAISSGTINWGNPVFVENFNGSAVNLTHWGVYNVPNGSPRSGTPYTKASTTVSGGYLNLTGHYQAPYGYVGGGIMDKANQTYGRWVIRFRAANGEGYEPAILLWPEHTHADGEIDIAEVYPGTALPKSTNRLGAGQFLHMGADNAFIWHFIPPSVNFSQWHTVAVDWLPNNISMYLDGKLTWSVGKSYQGKGDFIPTTPFHLALQLDEGCTRNRCAPNKSTPAKVVMQVDWVRIYAAPKA